MASAQNKIKYTFYTKQVSMHELLRYIRHVVKKSMYLTNFSSSCTQQAQQIAQQMKDYTVINRSSGNKRRKSVEFNLKQSPKPLEKQTFPVNSTIQC